MIARLTGIIASRRPEFIILDVGGVGYRVFVSLNTFCDLPEKGKEAQLAIHTIVRDDHIHLYGFGRVAEQDAFERLIAVKGVGPKLALGICSAISPEELWPLVKTGDVTRLSKIPGIGKKTAARLVVELEGRLPEEDPEAKAEGESAEDTAALRKDAVSALMNLGYPEARAEKAADGAVKESDPEASLEDILRASLKKLAG